jgi:hypothetical protein
MCWAERVRELLLVEDCGTVLTNVAEFWRHEIQTALNEACSVIVLSSSDSVVSSWYRVKHRPH